MTIIQAILLAVLYYWSNSAICFGVNWWTVMRPLVSGTIAGLILGDPARGALIGAQINILYLGFIGAGGAVPSDLGLAGVAGTALAITGNLSVEAAMALAVPVGLLGTIIWVVKLTLNSAWVRVAEKMAAKGDTEHYWIPNVLLPQALLFVMSVVPAFLIIYYGAEHIKPLIDLLGDRFLTVLQIVGGMLPAVGVALTLKSIFKGEAIVFFFLGFLMVEYFGFTNIKLGFIAIVITVLYMQIKGGFGEGLNLFRKSDKRNENAYQLLDKKTIWSAIKRWAWFNQANYNYERMQGTGFCYSMTPIIRKLYPQDADKRAELMSRHMEFFNTEPQWGACILGLTAALEEQRALGNEDVSEEVITSLKLGLMGPLAGIGDTIDGGVVTPLLLTLFIGITSTGNGNVIGPVLYALCAAGFMWTIYYNSYKLGYEKGSDAIVAIMESGVINKLILAASILGCLVLGGLVGSYVTVNCGINVMVSDGGVFSLQKELFDAILPGMLPMLLTLGCYALVRKNVSSVKIIVAVIIIGIIGGLLGILA